MDEFPLPALCCPRCQHPIGAPRPEQTLRCEKCALELRLTPGGVTYDYLSLLRQAFGRRYRLYKALCNNGYVSYQELAEGSLSLPERKDVAEFGRFLARFTEDGNWILDLGCGPLAVPGYLQPLLDRGVRLIGLDIYPTQFAGFRIVGCAEFLPLPAGSMDLLVFATSLDHVCDLHATMREVRRVLRAGGRCGIWMSDRQPYWRQFFFSDPTLNGIARRFLYHLPKQMAVNLSQRRRLFYGILHFFTHGRYWEYANGSVFYCPPGAIDPFHSFFESPAQIEKLAVHCGLSLAARERGSNGVFLCFRRGN